MKQEKPRRARPRDTAGKVAAFLATKQLMKQVKADFAELPSEAAFWNLPEFVRLRTKQASERDRLTLDNVLMLIEHTRDPSHLQKLYDKVQRGELRLAQFVKKVITPRPNRSAKSDTP